VTVFDDAAGFSDKPLLSEESLNDDETDEDQDEGYSPPERPWGCTPGVTADEAVGYECLSRRLSRELSELGEEVLPVGTGDLPGPDGELADGQVGGLRAGRLVQAGADEMDARSNYWASDVGIDGGASAEEAAVHVIPDNREG
jgi:hypothetical protein